MSRLYSEQEYHLRTKDIKLSAADVEAGSRERTKAVPEDGPSRVGIHMEAD